MKKSLCIILVLISFGCAKRAPVKPEAVYSPQLQEVATAEVGENMFSMVYAIFYFKNFAVYSLLDTARQELDPEDRKKTLNDIQEIISTKVPAIFLYSPAYHFALSDSIQNTYFENLATASDRFARISDWYARVDRRLNEGVNPLTFFSWLTKQF